MVKPSPVFADTCGTDTYFGRTTYCSVSALGRKTADNYSGCKIGEFCIVNETKEICGQDQYLGKPTYCSISAVGRATAPYSGCADTQFCLIDVGGAITGTCGKDNFQNKPTYCSISTLNRTVAYGFAGCRTGESCVTDLITTGQLTNTSRQLCGALSSESTRINCDDCFSKNGAWTALGCIPTDPSAFIGFILTIGIGMAGGIAFLLILFGGFQILTSAGNPEHLNAGKELVGSAIAGLLLIIFSVFILRIIGVNILGIPGFL